MLVPNTDEKSGWIPYDTNTNCVMYRHRNPNAVTWQWNHLSSHPSH